MKNVLYSLNPAVPVVKVIGNLFSYKMFLL